MFETAHFHLPFRNLSDAKGQGLITGGIPHQWIPFPSDAFFNLYPYTNSNGGDAAAAMAFREAVKGSIKSSTDPLWNPEGPSLSKIRVM